jgi:hypothetical protein
VLKLTEWMTGVRPRERERAEPPVENLMSSPLFTRLTEQLAAAGRCSLLDLGPARGANVSFFGQQHCKLQIADCVEGLLDLNARTLTEPTALAEALEQEVPLSADEPCDAVLAWDLFNYLDKPLLKALMLHLAPVVTGDTWLHAYIGARREMPALPAQYRLTREGQLSVKPNTGELRRCPCYSQPDLHGLMPQFQVARSTLLQNGVQEYLFRGQGGRHRAAR